LVNMIGNGVATVVVARWEKEFDRDNLQNSLRRMLAGSHNLQT
jgi:Na+/H+-dicarboxylate symporter